MNLKRVPILCAAFLFLILAIGTNRAAADHLNWQTLEAGMLKVHWYQGDERFGQAALDAAQAGLETIGRYIPIRLEQTVEIFIYASADDLQHDRIPDSENWIAGHADPALGVVMVVISPGVEQNITMEQRIPHELMHVMLYRQLGAGYRNLPVWLREGMATLVETYPNTEYDRVLLDAAAKNTLIPLNALCDSFPVDAGEAFLAYGQSRSFTDYLQDTYGSAGVLHLATTYADGVTCVRGPERAFGISLASLEAQWRSSVLGQNSLSASLERIMPYLVLLCLVLIIPLIGIVNTFRMRKRGNRYEPGNSVRR
jgi:hypothetical protein